MSIITYFVLLGLVTIFLVVVFPYVPQFMVALNDSVTRYPLSPGRGMIASLTGAVATLIFVITTQNRRMEHHATRYRWVEEKLIELKKMEVDEILRYHTEFHWDVYAGMAVSALLVVVSLLYTDKSVRPPEEVVVIFVSLFLLAVSAVMLAIIDMFHTNTLSPLITLKKRFQLIDLILKIGSSAIILQVCAISSFVSLINGWLSIAVSATALTLIAFFAVRRGVTFASLKAERNLSDDELEEIRKA